MNKQHNMGLQQPSWFQESWSKAPGFDTKIAAYKWIHMDLHPPMIWKSVVLTKFWPMDAASHPSPIDSHRPSTLSHPAACNRPSWKSVAHSSSKWKSQMRKRSLHQKRVEMWGRHVGVIQILTTRMQHMDLQGLVTVPFWEYWTSPYSSHYRPYT